MRIVLGTFACTSITTQMGVDLPTGVRTALLHYAGKLRSGRKPIAMPAFPFDSGTSEEAEVAVDLTLDARTEALLEEEAARQGTSVGRLASHSVLVYLAELDFLGAPPALDGDSTPTNA
jgi:hypothetical protein